ncbi:hybrid cluster-associated redox disulfide protein [Constrictibacter sp. MBR-5]|jgi:hybrid cluster-associated redox disulfide protein|uniref:hypothetical protein n=1 Tax=Constrictibacter sp. MBR-5 TaxID=3156467 RepID=UPI003396A099
MSSTQLDEIMVAEVMERWPYTVRVFNRRRMACPGCVMAPFMTVAEAATSYSLSPAELVADLVEAMDAVATDASAGATSEWPAR